MHLIASVVLIKIQRATTEKYCDLCALVKDITAYKDTASTLCALVKYITAYKDTVSTLCALENHCSIVLLATEKYTLVLCFFLVVLEQDQDKVRLFTA